MEQREHPEHARSGRTRGAEAPLLHAIRSRGVTRDLRSAFVDWMLNFGEETIQSTIKIRQAGFADCIDTHRSFRRQLTRLRELRIVA